MTIQNVGDSTPNESRARFVVLSTSSDSGQRVALDLSTARRFELPECELEPKPIVYYRFDSTRWVEERPVDGNTTYHAAELHDVVVDFLKYSADSPDKNLPDELTPDMRFPLSWTALFADEELELMDCNDAPFISRLRVTLLRLPTGAWILANLGEARTPSLARSLSPAEALDLLVRDGYPTSEYALPDELLAVCQNYGRREIESHPSADRDVREPVQTGAAGPLKAPSRRAVIVHRYQLETGKKQVELAQDPILMGLLGRPVNQGTISRWLNQVKRWNEAGNSLPDIGVPDEIKPRPLDPKIIDLGQRKDGRANHQRARRVANEDD